MADKPEKIKLYLTKYKQDWFVFNGKKWVWLHTRRGVKIADIQKTYPHHKLLASSNVAVKKTGQELPI